VAAGAKSGDPPVDLAPAAKRAVDAALAAGAGDAEGYAVEQSGREVRVHGGEVESLSDEAQRGLGVRAWIGGRVGYAYGTDLSEDGLKRLGGDAAEAAKLADEDEFAAPPQPQGEAAVLDGLHDPSLAATPTTDVVDLALALERAALREDSRVGGVETAVYADSTERMAIVSSAGVEGSYEASSCFAYAQALAEGEGAKETGLGFGLARGPAGLDPGEIGAEAGRRAAAMIGAGKPPSRACPAVFDPTVAASFIGLIGSVLGADAVQRGRSPFAERLGDEVAADAFVLRDDGTDTEGLQASPFDDEGVPRRPTALIEGGRLLTFLHDTYTARRGGADSTASAGRGGYRSAPSVSASNLVLGDGQISLAELLGRAGDGVYITDVAGLHSGVNPVSGTFSVGASGHLIEAGELGEPVREFTIASDLVSMLRAVAATGGTPRWVPFGGSVRTPHLLISEMTVSGS
jgi:PmbA protein